MTQKYESVLSEADVLEVAIEHAKSCGESRGKAIQILKKDPTSKELFFAVIRLAEKAVLAKLQPQLDAIGAGGVSGQTLRQPRVPEGYKLVPIEPTNKQVCLIACEIIGYDETGTCRTDTPLWPEYVRKAESAYKAMLAASPEPSND